MNRGENTFQNMRGKVTLNRIRDRRKKNTGNKKKSKVP